MIEKASQLSLRRQCELLGLNRAGLYYQPVAVGAYELKLWRSSTASICAPILWLAADDCMASEPGPFS